MSPTAWFQLALVVFVKETRDGLRDRKALLSGLALPFLGPLLCAAMFTVIAGQVSSPPDLDVPLVGAEHAPGLVAFLEAGGAEVVEPPTDPDAAVASGELPFVLVVDDGFERAFREARPATVEMWVDSSRRANEGSERRLRRLVEAYGRQIATQRLVLRGVDPKLLRPIDLTELDVADAQQRGANLLEVLIMFIVLSAFLGSMYLVMDTTAGERERRSLEPLLSLPVPRSALVGGKFVASVLFGLWGVLIAAVVTAFAMNLAPLEALGVRVGLTPISTLKLVGVLLPLVPVAASVQLLLASGATSFKEAQTWLSLMMMAPMVPGMVLAFQPMNPTLSMMAVPALAQQMLASQVLRGDALDLAEVALSAGSAGLVTLAALGALTWLFGQERILRHG